MKQLFKSRLIIFVFNIDNFSIVSDRTCLCKRIVINKSSFQGTVLFLSVTSMVISIIFHGVTTATDSYTIWIEKFTGFIFNRFSSFIIINQRYDIHVLRKLINCETVRNGDKTHILRFQMLDWYPVFGSQPKHRRKHYIEMFLWRDKNRPINV